MAQVTESDYRIAQQGATKVRQEFLDAIDFEDSKDFIKSVKYDFKGDYFGEHPSLFLSQDITRCRAATTYPGEIEQLFRGKKSAITVFESLFTEPFPLFLSILVDHEGYHSVQYAERNKYFMKIATGENSFFSNATKKDATYLVKLKEATAYAAQIQNATKRGLEDNLRDKLSIRIQNELKSAM